MQINEAFDLINNDFINDEKQSWCDLGCGTGIFTIALAELLLPESIIYAVDTNKSALKSIPKLHQNVIIKKYSADFLKEDFPSSNLDGILMANSLHFIADKISFIRKIENSLKPDSKLLIIEYDNDLPNPYVPYPLSYQSLKALFSKIGYANFFKINTRKSLYNSGDIYSVLISK